MNSPSSETREASAERSTKLTAIISGITGFIAAVGALLAAINAFPKESISLFLSNRESGFIKAANQVDTVLSGVHFFPNNNEACQFAKAKYAELRTTVSSSQNIDELVKKFDEANTPLERAANFRMLAQIFINTSDVLAWRSEAAKNGCLSPD